MPDDLIPAHVAIVMDGNGRWAKQRKLTRTAGHKQGVKATQEIIKASSKAGVKYLTLFAFSSENWKRPRSEVSALMELFMQSLQNEVQSLVDNGVRLQFIGQKEAFSKKLYQQIRQAEERTANNDKLFLNIAASYSGKWDIVNAVKDIIQEFQHSNIPIDSVNEQLIEKKLATAGMPAPDLFIRTGGEQRISNFLLWQLAYTELYFCDILWPEFNADELEKAFQSYRLRQRRYGQTQEQVAS